MDNSKLIEYLSKIPPVYAPGDACLWTDEHISKQMLVAHLNPEIDAASRNHSFIRRSVKWIAGQVNDVEQGKLLDLGCGPGIYAELFDDAGFQVTGVDFSENSIAYATRSAIEHGKSIRYECRSYLNLDYCDEFDIATMIYCDFGVLSEADRHKLLCGANRALRDKGMLIFDTFGEAYYEGFKELDLIEHSDGGFWSDEPNICLQRSRKYASTRNVLDQYIVLTKDRCKCFNTWNQAFSIEKLTDELKRAGFVIRGLYADVCGMPYSEQSETLCVVAEKALSVTL